MDTPLHYFFSRRTNPRTFDVLTRGPLGPYLTAYAQRLDDDGYATQSGELQLRMLGHFNQWLERQRMDAAAVTSLTVERYVRSRRRAGKLRRGDPAALVRVLAMLRRDHAEPHTVPLTAIQCVVQEFQDHLRHERGLADATLTNYTPIVAAFLVACCPAGVPDFPRVTARAIADFVRQQAERITTKRVTLVVSALRSFLRYLLQRGLITTDLRACVPTIATWSLSTVPRFLPADQIQRILDACPRDTVVGTRNYAILLLLARLGLRAGEIVALTLDDIDWDAGLITVRGKGKRVAQMPVPVDVGAAITAYLCHARQACASRRVFLRAKAPLRGFANSIAICSLVDRALETAHVDSAYRGTHLFRHSLATHMLAQGASLPEIGDVLRHRRPDTTAIYAKVDVGALRSIALSWPGGDQ